MAGEGARNLLQVLVGVVWLVAYPQLLPPAPTFSCLVTTDLVMLPWSYRMQSVFLKSSSSVALPIYQAAPEQANQE